MSENEEMQEIDSPKFLKKMLVTLLKDKLFKGTYVETRYVDQLEAYREVIRIDESDPIIPIINDLVKRLKKQFPNVWIGYTNSGQVGGSCLWVNMNDIKFEPYNYKIIKIEIKQGEIAFILQPKKNILNTETESFNFEEIADKMNKSLNETLKNSLVLARDIWQCVTIENFKQIVKFAVIFLCTIGNFGIQAADYSIKLIYAISDLIRSLTPAFEMVINLLGKIFGAFFVLIAMVWKDCFGNDRRNNSYPINYTLNDKGHNAIEYRQTRPNYGQKYGRNEDNYH